MEEIEMEKVIEKYFPNFERTCFYHGGDAWQNLVGDSYVKYSYHNQIRSEVIVWVGNNEGEVPIKICKDPKELDTLLKILIY